MAADIYIYVYIYIFFFWGWCSYWFPIFHVSIFMFPFEGGKAPVEEPIRSKFYHDDIIFYHDDRKFYQHDRILIEFLNCKKTNGFYIKKIKIRS